MQPESLTLTVPQVAEHLHLSMATAYRLIRRGDIPAIRVGQQLRVPRAALEARLRVTTSEPDK